MIERTTRPLARRALIVDDELRPGRDRRRPQRARARRGASRPRDRGRRGAVLRGRPGHRRLRRGHPLRLRQLDPGPERPQVPRARPPICSGRCAPRNAKVPVFLMADRKVAGTVTVEVATLADEFVWILEDTASFIGGRARGRDRALRPGPAAAVHGGPRALRPGPGVLLGGSRPPGRRRLPQVARRPRLLRLLRREPLPHGHGDRARALSARFSATRPDRGERDVHRPGVRRAPLVLGAERHLGLEPGHHVRLRRRQRDRALRPELPQVDRAGPRPHRRHPRLPEPHPQPLRDHRADPAGSGSSRRRSRRRSPRTRSPRAPRARVRSTRCSRTAPTTACATTPRTPRPGSRRASTASTSTRPGTATRASTRCTATATRCEGVPPTTRRTVPPSLRRTPPTSCWPRSPRPRSSTSATAAAPSTTAASTRPTPRRPAPPRSTRSSHRTRSRPP